MCPWNVFNVHVHLKFLKNILVLTNRRTKTTFEYLNNIIYITYHIDINDTTKME